MILLIVACRDRTEKVKNKVQCATLMASLKIVNKEVQVMYAVIETGGKQVRVEEGMEIYVEKLDVEAGNKVTFDKVLLVADNGVKVGNPYLSKVTVEGTIEKHGKQKKIIVFKMKPKKKYRKKQGHRQAYTKVVIDKINA